MPEIRLSKDVLKTNTEIMFQLQHVLPHTPEGRRNWNKLIYMKADKCSRKFTRGYYIEQGEFNTIEKVCFMIRKYFGFGDFNIMIWNNGHISTKYNSNFTCVKNTRQGCSFFRAGRCKIWRQHKQGWACKKNRKQSPNFEKHASVRISPKQGVLEDTPITEDYIFAFKNTKMHRFSWWLGHERIMTSREEREFEMYV